VLQGTRQLREHLYIKVLFKILILHYIFFEIELLLFSTLEFFFVLNPKKNIQNKEFFEIPKKNINRP
jgi:hypothetical protein